LQLAVSRGRQPERVREQTHEVRPIRKAPIGSKARNPRFHQRFEESDHRSQEALSHAEGFTSPILNTACNAFLASEGLVGLMETRGQDFWEWWAAFCVG
jgi:hypothetical protein